MFNEIRKIFNISIIVALAIGFVSLVTVTSCNKDPKPGEDPTPEKLHEDPSKVVFKLVECHLHADWYQIQEVGGPHQNPPCQAKHFKRIQTVSYELKKKEGWKLSEGSQDKFYVVKNGEYNIGKKFTPAPIYLFFIEYYDKNGKLMNNQFVENGQDKIHQHFFTPIDIEPTFDGDPLTDEDKKITNLVEYLYTDTTPWNKTKHDGEAEITGRENPIGLKGVIRFKRERVNFNLSIRLYHGYDSKRDPKTNEFAPFYKPSPVLIQKGTWDINLKIPVTVFISRDDYIDVDEDTDLSAIPEDSLPEDENKTVHSYMKAFGLTWIEALQEFVDYTYKIGDAEEGHIWL